MKTIKNLSTNEVKRVKDEVALIQVSSSKFSYAPKSEWKMVRTPIQVNAAINTAMLVPTPEQERAIQQKADNKKHRNLKKNSHKEK